MSEALTTTTVRAAGPYVRNEFSLPLVVAFRHWFWRRPVTHLVMSGDEAMLFSIELQKAAIETHASEYRG
jgi:hypothetical protein